MANGPPRVLGPMWVPTGLAELHQKAPSGRPMRTLSGMPALPHDSVINFRVAPGEHFGFTFLETFGPRAVRAFKLLEAVQSKASSGRTDRLSAKDLGLLTRLLGTDFVALAWRAYETCKDFTQDPCTLAELDERTAWRLNEFLLLYENVMTLGVRRGALVAAQAAHVRDLLVRDFGVYYGLLVDDVAQTKPQRVAAIIDYLREFRRTPRFRPQVPLDKMARLPLGAPLSVNLLDYEIARALEAHPIAVKERIVRGDDEGGLESDEAVSFRSHQLTVFYCRELDDEERAIVDAILPVFALSAFDGFVGLGQVDEHLTRRRQVIRQSERECFALLQCLQHYGGRVPPTMKEFRASDVMKAAQRVYRQREKERDERRRKAVTGGAMLKERLSGTLQAMGKPVTFSWPGDRTVFQLPGYPDELVFFPQEVTIRSTDADAGADAGANADATFTFLCHARRDRDPAYDTPLMFEYQVVLQDSYLFDAHAALRDLFASAPDTFRRTLDAGPVVLFAKETIYADEGGADAEVDEVRLLGTYVALNGGMKSWVGQHYLLSRNQGNVFLRYPDVRAYYARLLPEA